MQAGPSHVAAESWHVAGKTAEEQRVRAWEAKEPAFDFEKYLAEHGVQVEKPAFDPEKLIAGEPRTVVQSTPIMSYPDKLTKEEDKLVHYPIDYPSAARGGRALVRRS